MFFKGTVIKVGEDLVGFGFAFLGLGFNFAGYLFYFFRLSTMLWASLSTVS